jgi:hypothetical protein
VRELERQVKSLSNQRTVSSKVGLDSPSGLSDGAVDEFRVDVRTPNTPLGLGTGLSNQHSQFLNPTRSKEVTGVNRHTKNVEFYGSSSSMALLSRVRENEHNNSSPLEPDEDEGSLVSQLHNPAFATSPPEGHSQTQPALENTVLYHHQCRTFLNGYFSTIHYIHPILDKSFFLGRCEDIWSGNSHLQSRSFMALYYSLLSLGALVGSREEEATNGMGNLEWSRKFFEKARVLCSELSMTTDLEMVQCFFFMVRCRV